MLTNAAAVEALAALVYNTPTLGLTPAAPVATLVFALLLTVNSPRVKTRVL